MSAEAIQIGNRPETERETKAREALLERHRELVAAKEKALAANG